ncbi:MAG: phospholipase [Chloroflexi bacterium]|nr:MAG: phospholipase [Chloroflexota bacterium]MBL1195135.1 phospholipase [Chloroflexota bacterium]NOH12420.1 phospholipase [Chloroflexota bacterium]
MKKTLFVFFLMILLTTACSTVEEPAPKPTEVVEPTKVVSPPTNTPAPTDTEYKPTHPAITADSLQPGQTPYAFLSSSDVEIRYLFYLPENYDPSIRWPLILFLHGGDGNGMNINRIMNKTLPNYIENLPDFPFIVVSPQLPNGFWPKLIDPIDELLDHLIEVLPIDADHIYLTGLSGGGYGTWKYALKYPDRFAAIAPIAGGPSVTTDRVPEDICTLKELPIWAFHGEEDLIPPEQNIEPIEALEACSGNVRLTLYPDTGHDAWTPTYTNPDFYDWLLQHSK